MKRLTERDKNKTAMAICCGENCKYNFCCENSTFSECGDMDDIIDRLAAIEDILGDEYELDRLKEVCEIKNKPGGLMDLIEELKKSNDVFLEVASRYSELGDYYRLKELVEADREGRCVVLPCNVGDKIFCVMDGTINKMTVRGFRREMSEQWKMVAFTDKKYPHWTGYEMDFSQIGNTIFLSYTEAEAAIQAFGDEPEAWYEHDPVEIQERNDWNYYKHCIETLRADLARATAERDAAFTALNTLRLASGWQCYECDNADAPEGDSRCNGCNYIEGNNYKWRGIKEED